MGNGQTEPWKEAPSMSINRIYLNSHANVKPTEGEKHNRASKNRDYMESYNPCTEFKGCKQRPEETFEKVAISPLIQ